MTMYADLGGKLTEVGYASACSMYDPDGHSFVHIYKDQRAMLGLPCEPYDWFFDTYREALNWASSVINDLHIGF